MWAITSAILRRISPKLHSGCPNWWRCLVYGTACFIVILAPPIVLAPSLKRPTFRMLKAMWWPLPISPSTLPAGTFTSSRMMGQVLEPLMPILCSSGPIVTPGDFRSTMKAVNLSPSIFANTMQMSA